MVAAILKRVSVRLHTGLFAVAAIAMIAGEWFPYNHGNHHDCSESTFSISDISVIIVATMAVIATTGEWF